MNSKKSKLVVALLALGVILSASQAQAFGLGNLVSADSFTTGTVAAACGGTTTIIDFATPQPEQTMLDALAARRAEADGNVAIDYSLHMTIPTWHGADAARLKGCTCHWRQYGP